MYDRLEETMSVCDQLMKAVDRINTLTIDINNEVAPDVGDELLELYNGFRLDELEHAQVLLLKLTELLTQTKDAHSDDADGSAFAEGELTDNIGDKTSEEDALDITLEPDEADKPSDNSDLIFQILNDALEKVEKRKAAVPKEA